MKRVALISDLHANAVALEAVLTDIGNVGVDSIVCLGDVATLGPQPRAVVQRLRALGCPCIKGNHDAFVLEPNLLETYTEVRPIPDAIAWCRDQLTADDLSFIRGFEDRLEYELEGGSLLSLFHGSPRSWMEDILSTTTEAELDEIFAGHRAAVFAGGHTHLQLHRPYRGAAIFNPGSVGCPFESYVGGGQASRPPKLLREAHYGIVEGSKAGVRLELKQVGFDLEELRSVIESTRWPMQRYYREQYG